MSNPIDKITNAETILVGQVSDGWLDAGPAVTPTPKLAYRLRGITQFRAAAWDEETVKINYTDPADIFHFDDTPIAVWAGTKVVRKEEDYPVEADDGELVIDSTVKNEFRDVALVDTGLTTDTKYYYAAFPYTDKGVYSFDGENEGTATPSLADDSSGAPGPAVLAAGTRLEGYYGLVSASELITGDVLASTVGIGGTSQFSDAGWLKFAWEGTVLFVAKKPIRSNISWNALETRGCIWGDGTSGGDATVTINGLTYKVRLLRGLNLSNDPKTTAASISGVACHGSEWNRLILPAHINAKPGGSWGGDLSNVEAHLPYWGSDFTDADLNMLTSNGNGAYSWCQELATSAPYRVYRGGSSAAYVLTHTATTGTANYGWRPVLELIL